MDEKMAKKLEHIIDTEVEMKKKADVRGDPCT
jgi:hypothetical protein